MSAQKISIRSRATMRPCHIGHHNNWLQETQASIARHSPVKYPARIAPLAESGELRAAERQIGTQGCDSRSVLDRAGAVSGLNPGQPAA